MLFYVVTGTHLGFFTVKSIEAIKMAVAEVSIIAGSPSFAMMFIVAHMALYRLIGWND